MFTEHDPPDGNQPTLRDGNDPEEGGSKRALQAWRTVVRPSLLVVEALAVLKQHEALAATARALVMIGDVITQSYQD
ncbi:hypothetical protein [Amycolatopsis sp. NBC_01286]|uniref:hypothetical protein n=1 Tax=Amycolatopsis sp. NBC_01286 TaxID=2903560 RepID=UPI002E118677|nr:hypothetical protein OG570_16970 [Amycolatopsis sp. NBC_01286]